MRFLMIEGDMQYAYQIGAVLTRIKKGKIKTAYAALAASPASLPMPIMIKSDAVSRRAASKSFPFSGGFFARGGV